MHLAAAGLQHETNSFSPRQTGWEDFLRADSWPALTEGAALWEAMDGLNVPLAGFLGAARAASVRVTPLMWAAAEPAGPVTRDAFARLSSRLTALLDAAGPVDGLYLDLHGAMILEGAEDGEAALLRLLRDRLGPSLPVVVSLDLHAKVSPEMARLADRIAIYRTYPHLDMAETGARCLDLLRALAGGSPRPHRALRHGRYLIPMAAQWTGRAPARDLYAEAQAASQGAEAVEIALGFPAGDTEWTGPAILAYAPNAARAEALADAFADRLAGAEPAFAEGVPLPVGEAVAQAVAATGPGGPVVLADVADNPGGGATSDTTGLLRALIGLGARGAVLGLVHAPEAACAAFEAGAGATLDLTLGCAHPWPGDAPLTARFGVVSVSDAPVRYLGAMYGGGRAMIGRSAVLRIDDPRADIRVIVTEIPNQALDRGFFLHHGIDPSACAILALKSSVHYRADFAPIARAVIEADAPGRLPADPSTLPFRHLRDGLRLRPRALQESPV